MKKFTINSQLSDTDSGHFSAGATSSDSSFRMQDTGCALILKVSVIPLLKQFIASVSSKALVNHVKQRLIIELGSQISDSANYGLFIPPANGRNGKFLEEDRPISAYLTNESNFILEFVHKRRLCSPTTFNVLPSEKDKNNSQSFIRAVVRGDIKKVEKFLSKGFDPNFVCPITEESPLSAAVGRPKLLEMIKVLIAGGAHKDFRTKGGATPLHKAASIGNFEAVKVLLDFGQSPNTLDSNGLTPLYHNIIGDVDTRICHRLLYDYAQIDIYDMDGKLEIHQAALLGRTDHINLLVMYGADVNARSLPQPQQNRLSSLPLPTKTAKNFSQSSAAQLQLHRIVGCGRETPLHYAAIAGKSVTAKRLLYWGADPTLINEDGRTPLQEAINRGNHEVAEIIRHFHGEVNGKAATFSASERSSCGPFLPAPTYNQKRKPMTAPLQVPLLDDYVSLALVSSERKAQIRSVTMPFPARPTSSTGKELLKQHNTLDDDTLDLSSSQSFQPPTNKLRARASSEGDLVWSLEEEGAVDEMEKDDDLRGECLISPAQRLRPNVRSSQKKKLMRGYTDNTVINDRLSTRNYNRRRLKSWKSSHTLNETSNTNSSFEDDDEALDVVPLPEPQRFECHLRRPVRLTGPSSEQPRTSQTSFAPVEQLPIREQVLTRRTVGRESAPVPANPFTLNPISPRAVSPRQRDLHHFSRSPTHSPSFNDGANRRVQMGSETTRTVILRKAYLPDAPRTPTLGLSLRTVQNASAVKCFVPHPEKPSLQLVKGVKQASPAFNAGIREGDYITKINHVDVTRACHTEVVNLLDALHSNSVVLEVIRPESALPSSIPQHTSDKYVNHLKSSRPTPTTGPVISKAVQRSVSLAGRVTYNNGPAPYSPMLPMHAPPKNRCASPGESSISSTDEAFFSQSVSRASSNLTIRQSSALNFYMGRHGNNPPPRIHTAADYRIRHQFPTAVRTSLSRQLHPPNKTNLRNIPKSHTFNSFREDIGADTSSLGSYIAPAGSLSPPSRDHIQPSCSKTTPMMCAYPVHSVPQPPLRYLPGYSSQVNRDQGSDIPRRRYRETQSFNPHLRPLSMTSPDKSLRDGDNDFPRSFSAMSANTRLPQGAKAVDPNDLVLPPPEKFCC